MTSRADRLKSISPELMADLWLYPSEDGGRAQAIVLGWGSPCTIHQKKEQAGSGTMAGRC